MAIHTFESTDDVIKKLLQKYAIFNSDIDFYKEAALPYSRLSLDKMFYKTESVITSEIRKSVKDDNDWLIKYIEQELKTCRSITKALNNIGDLCSNWRLDIDIDTLKVLVDTSSVLNDALSQVMSTFKEITMTNIERFTSNKALVDILIGYAMINDLLKEEDAQLENENIDIPGFMSDDSVKLYLREIGKIPLLNPEQERELSYKAKQGSKAAKDALAEHNLRLVVSLAKRFLGRGLDFNDLIQAGNEGLLKAVDKYDPEKGYKFSTYATWWIRQSIDRTIKDEGRTIRVPVHLQESYNKLKAAREKLMGMYGESVSWEDVAAYLGIPLKKVESIVNNFKDMVSINSFVGDEEDTELGDFLSDPDDLTPEELAMKKALNDALTMVLDTLTSREEQILRLRFGLQNLNNPNPDYDRTHTLEECGAFFGVTRERIRQVEAKALRKLSNTSRRYKLAGFYPGQESPVKTFNDSANHKPAQTPKPSPELWTQEQKDKFGIGQNSEPKKPRKHHKPAQGNGAKESRKYHKPEKYLYEVLECTPDEFRMVKYFLKYKDSDSYKVFFLIYGDNLNQIGSFNSISAKQRNNYNSALHFIRSKIALYRKSYIFSLREALELTEDEYKIALEYIKGLENIEVLKVVHGEDLSLKSNTKLLEKQTLAEYQKILADVRSYVKNIKNTKGLRQIIECPAKYWDDFKNYICQNTRYSYEVLSPIFGSDLSLELTPRELEAKTNRDYESAIVNLKAKLTFMYRYVGKNLVTIANIPEKECEETLEYLKGDAYLVSLFGSDLLSEINVRMLLNLNEEEIKDIMETVKKARKRVGTTLQRSLQLGDEDIDVIAALNASLDINTTYRDTLRNLFGPVLLDSKDPKVDIHNLLARIRRQVKIALTYKNKTIYEIAASMYGFELKPVNIVKLRSYLRMSPNYEAFADLFGKDLNEPMNLAMYFAYDGRRSWVIFNKNLVGIINSCNEHTPYDEIIESYENKYLDEIFGQTVCPIEDIKAYVSKLDVDLVALLKSIHGENFDQRFMATNPVLTLGTVKKYEVAIATINNLYTYVQNPNPIVTAEAPTEPDLSTALDADDSIQTPSTTPVLDNPVSASEVDLTIYNIPLFREAIKVVPIEYRYILMFHLGLGEEGIAYSNEDLALIFNRSEEEIQNALLRGKIFFDEIVASFEKVYNRTLDLNALNGQSRKRQITEN